MIQQKLTKTKTKVILITKTLLIFSLFYTPALNMRAWLKVNHDSLVDMGM